MKSLTSTARQRTGRSPAQAVGGKHPRIALALAGGGPLGAIYEIGALCALQEALPGLDFNALDHYIGVSAGGFIAASLANGITPRQLCNAFIEGDTGSSDYFDPAWLMVPAWGEFSRRAIMTPGVVGSALWRFALGSKSITAFWERLGPALPTGVFSSDQVHVQLQRLFSQPGRTNDFRQLRSKLTLVATNLDSGEAAPFGRPGWDHVPISRAVQASASLPGLFPPVEIDEHYYVDGALKKTMHASVALDDGADLLLCLNPLVPFNATEPSGPTGIPRIVDGGLPAVLSQTFRSMIHSRMALGMKHYERAYPQADIVLFEPDPRDTQWYLANTFSYSQRRQLAQHAYTYTRQWLLTHRATLQPKLARHGVQIDMAALQDPSRPLLAAASPSLLRLKTGAVAPAAELHAVLDRLSGKLPTRQTLSQG